MHGFIDQAGVDFITNGQAEGPLAGRLAGVRFDPGLMRPWICPDGGKYLDVMTGRQVYNEKTKRREPERESVPLATFVSNGLAPPVFNVTALPKDVWELIDRTVIRASRDRLRAWSDIAAANTFGGFNGMAVTSLIRDTVTDPGQVRIDMDGITDSDGDTPLFYPDLLPLPIVHSGFYLSSRVLAQSRNSNTPLDTFLAESSSRRVAEEVEKMTIGVTDLSSFKLGSSTEYTNRGIYGFITHPDRITKVDLTPSASFVADTFLNEILAMRDLAFAQKVWGPFVLYTSTNWDQYLDRDYVTGTSAQGLASPSRTVRQRVEMIDGINAVRRLDFLTSTDVLILVQMTSDTVRAVNGMDFITVQYETKGGMQINFKVMVIHVPDIRSQFVGTSTTVGDRVAGIVHATTS